MTIVLDVAVHVRVRAENSIQNYTVKFVRLNDHHALGYKCTVRARMNVPFHLSVVSIELFTLKDVVHVHG
jgi:hypothetical protein